MFTILYSDLFFRTVNRSVHHPDGTERLTVSFTIPMCLLFHCYGCRQIPWLVHIVAAVHCCIVRIELVDDYGYEWCEHFMHMWYNVSVFLLLHSFHRDN